MDTQDPKSEYCKQRKRNIKELSKHLAKEIARKNNKKQLSAFTFSTDSRSVFRGRANIMDVIDEDFDLNWIFTSERFKSFNRTK
jgi:hypothetical protein